MFRAVLFDLDDTLADQESAASAAVVSWARDHGVAGGDLSRRWSQISQVHYGRYQRRELTFAQQRRERARDLLAAKVDDDTADEFFDGYLRRYEAGWQVFADAVPALRRARAAGLTVAVLTNGDEEHQRFKVETLGLADHLDLMIASSVLPAGKPDPRAFAHALDLVGVAAHETLMVGNSLDHDVRGALAAGPHAVLLDRHDAHPGVDLDLVTTLDDLTFAGRADVG